MNVNLFSNFQMWVIQYSSGFQLPHKMNLECGVIIIIYWDTAQILVNNTVLSSVKSKSIVSKWILFRVDSSWNCINLRLFRNISFDNITVLTSPSILYIYISSIPGILELVNIISIHICLLMLIKCKSDFHAVCQRSCIVIWCPIFHIHIFQDDISL